MSATTNGKRPGTKRALLVDDNGLFREVLGVVLEHRVGFESVHAGSLAAARGVLDGRAGGVDLVVVDLGLPDGGGYELVEELRAVWPGVRVIGLGAGPDAASRARALGAGASEVLAMSASGEEIVAAAKRLGG